MRVLPDFLIVGAQRAGSTSLFDYVCRHPRVPAPSHKEIHFFDQNYFRGEGWYRSHFPTVLEREYLRRRHGAPPLMGESSPYYLFHPQVPGRVRETLSEARIVVLLRNPVERAYSHYQLTRRRGHESLSFEDAIAAEPDRLAGEEERMERDPRYASVPHRFHSYVARGMYADQLERWLAVFPCDRVLVLASEELFAKPDETYGRTLAFLGLPGLRLDDYRQLNRGGYEDMAPATRELLAERFREPNQRLYDLLDRDFGWESRERSAARSPGGKKPSVTSPSG